MNNLIIANPYKELVYEVTEKSYKMYLIHASNFYFHNNFVIFENHKHINVFMIALDKVVSIKGNTI